MFGKHSRDSKIRRITSRQAQDIVTPEEQSGNMLSPSFSPLGLFYAKEDGVYVGIDNSTGHAWTEEFKRRSKCLRWLKGKDD